MLHAPHDFDDLWSSYDQELGEQPCCAYPSGLGPADILEDMQLPDLHLLDNVVDAADRPVPKDVIQTQQRMSSLESASMERPRHSTLPPSSTSLSSAGNGGLARLDFHDPPAEDKYWQQQLLAQTPIKVTQSPFSASTVQSTTTISRPQQPNPYASCEDEDSLTIAGSFPLYSSALGSCISATSNVLCYGSEVLPSELSGADLERQYYQQGHPMPTTARQNRNLWTVEVEARHLSRTQSDAAGVPIAHRAASTPVPGADLPVEPRRKRSRDELAPTPAAPARGDLQERKSVPRILIPTRARGHCIRIVSGRGEFEAKPQNQTAWEKRVLSRVRSNELGLVVRKEFASGGDEQAGRAEGSRNNSDSFTGSRQSASYESAPTTEEMMTTRARAKMS